MDEPVEEESLLDAGHADEEEGGGDDGADEDDEAFLEGFEVLGLATEEDTGEDDGEDDEGKEEATGPTGAEREIPKGLVLTDEPIGVVEFDKGFGDRPEDKRGEESEDAEVDDGLGEEDPGEEDDEDGEQCEGAFF